MNPDIKRYNDSLSKLDCEICNVLARELTSSLPDADHNIWHGHPVWFLSGNPVAGYSKLKNCIRLLFWSGQSFDEPNLQPEGSFKAAEARFTSIDQIVVEDLRRWIEKSRAIQWDYQNIRKRRGELILLETESNPPSGDCC